MKGPSARPPVHGNPTRRAGAGRLVTLILTAFAALAGGTPLTAQEDFRHLDDGRPTRVEDAYPLKFLEWEWQLGAGGSLEEGERYEAETVLELKMGAVPNTQIGVEAHMGWAQALGSSATGVESFSFHTLYNLNQEGRRSPAVALRTDLFLPGVGDLAHQEPGGRLRAMATRSFGTTRVHGNVAREWRGTVDEGNRWSAGIGFDRALGFSSRAIVGSVYAESFDVGGPVRVWVDGGIRLQISKQSVLDAGVSLRMDEWVDGAQNVGVVIGLSRAFGFSGLARVPPYPDPAIR
ncbi:MAG: hypothetical protein ACR2QM_00405 [Longimicrobiales bacterium]